MNGSEKNLSQITSPEVVETSLSGQRRARFVREPGFSFFCFCGTVPLPGVSGLLSMIPRFLPSLLAVSGVFLISLASLVAADPPSVDREALQVAISEENYDQVISLTDKLPEDSPL
ncbi:MAG: hypothetical protein KDB27_04735, partial [Planctomycetales bacterium]|nr:hypothetical protein [Planctomycetales bacterium]